MRHSPVRDPPHAPLLRQLLAHTGDVGSARKALPDVEIIEIERIVVAEFRHGQCLSSISVGFECPSSLQFSETDTTIHLFDTYVLRKAFRPK